jgi:hypothetical protein
VWLHELGADLSQDRRDREHALALTPIAKGLELDDRLLVVRDDPSGRPLPAPAMRALIAHQSDRSLGPSPTGCEFPNGRLRPDTRQAMSTNEMNASELIDQRIEELGDWRGKTLSKVRRLIKEADPEVVEEWKWAKATSPGTPVWSHNGGICTGEAYKSVVKLTFFKGASLDDPSGLFNSSLEGKVRRAIDIKENDEVDEAALKDLVREAAALNLKG